MQQRRRERDRAPGRLPDVAKHQRGPQPKRHDPHVLDRVKRQQPLELVRHQRVQHAAQARQRTHCHQRDPDPQPGRGEPLKQHAHEPVEGQLDHHPRHQRRDMRGRQRVSARQPGVQRHQPRLGGETDQRRARHERRQAAAQRVAAKRTILDEHEHRHPHTGAPDVRDRQVHEHAVAGLPILAGEQDRNRGHQRHQLPKAEKGAHVTGAHKPHQRQQEDSRGERQRAALPVRLQGVAREQRGRCPDDGDEEQKEAAEPVKAKRRAHLAAKPRANSMSRGEHPHAGRPNQHHADRLRGEPTTRRTTQARAQSTGEDRRHSGENQRLSGALIAGQRRRVT